MSNGDVASTKVEFPNKKCNTRGEFYCSIDKKKHKKRYIFHKKRKITYRKGPTISAVLWKLKEITILTKWG